MAGTPPLTTLYDRVVIRRDETPPTVGMILIPETSRLPMCSGIVEAVGHTVQIVKVGDRVLYGMFAGQDITLPADLGGAKRFFIYEKDIHAILPPVEAS